MPTASYTKFQPAIELMMEGGNAQTETYALKLATAINTTAGTITETTNGNGYTTGGQAISVASAAQSGGTYTLTMTQPTNPIWTAAGGTITFQYVVLVGSVSGPIAAWDYGTSQTVQIGETISVTITTIYTVT